MKIESSKMIKKTRNDGFFTPLSLITAKASLHKTYYIYTKIKLPSHRTLARNISIRNCETSTRCAEHGNVSAKVIAVNDQAANVQHEQHEHGKRKRKVRRALNIYPLVNG